MARVLLTGMAGAGKTTHRAEIRRYARDVEPLLRRRAAVELDGRRLVDEPADVIEDLLRR